MARSFFIRAGDAYKIRIWSGKNVFRIFCLSSAWAEKQRLHDQLTLVIQHFPFCSLTCLFYFFKSRIFPALIMNFYEFLFCLVRLAVSSIAYRSLRMRIRFFFVVFEYFSHGICPGRYWLSFERLFFKVRRHLAGHHACDIFLKIDLSYLPRVFHPHFYGIGGIHLIFHFLCL